MQRVLAAVAALLCLLFAATLRDVRLAAAPASSDAPRGALPTGRPAEEASSGAVRATIEGADGAPIERAVVRVFAVAAEAVYLVGERRTDAAGVATVPRVPAGEVWVVAYAAKRARASAHVAVARGETADVRLRLAPAEALRVIVTDHEDAPLAGVPVVVDDGDALPHVVATSKDGEALFERLGAAPWLVSATAPGFDPAVKRDVHPGPGALRLSLERLGTVEVAVIDAAGEPAEGATVTIGGPQLWPARTATTSLEGTVRVGGLRAGIVDLRARLGDQVSATEMGVVVTRGETTRRVLVLDFGRELLVRVVDASGVDGARGELVPVAAAEVVLTEDGVSTFPHEGITDEDGETLLGPVVEGRATLTVVAEGFVPRTLGVGDEALDAGFLEVPLSRGGTLEGEVVDERGYPVAGAMLEVIGVDLDGMPVAATAARSPLRDLLFDRAMAGPLPLIPRGELGVMPGPVPPIPSAVDAPLPDGSGAAPWIALANGSFSLGPVPPGRMRVRARHPDYLEGESREVRVVPGGKAKVKIVLVPGGRLDGRVREHDGTPVAGARIEVAATRGGFDRSTWTADDGTFAFAAVPSEILVSVARPGAPMDLVLRRVVQVPPGRRTEIDIRLPEPREDVVLRVVDHRGAPVAIAEVRCESLDVEVPLRRTIFSDTSGEATLVSALGLPLRVVVHAPGHAPLVREIDAVGREERLALGVALLAQGKVTGNGGRDRVAGAAITVATATRILGVTSGDDGTFEVKDLAPGPVRFSVTAEGWAGIDQVLDVAGDGRRPVELPALDLPRAGAVEGVVVDAASQPVAGARVGLDAVPTWLPLGPLPAGMVTTDREGRFLLPNAPEGSVRLEAYEVEAGRGAVEDVVVQPGRTTRRVEIALEGAGARSRSPSAGSLALTLGEKGGRVTIVSVPPTSEAEAARVMAGDVIVSVDARSVRSIEDARRALGGPLGQDVLLELQRAGTGRVRLRVRREQVRR